MKIYFTSRKLIRNIFPSKQIQEKKRVLQKGIIKSLILILKFHMKPFLLLLHDLIIDKFILMD